MQRLPRQVPSGRGSPLILLLASAWGSEPSWGEVLAGLGGCRECHTREGGAPFAGGEPLETRFGTFVGPNITPDPVHGIGAWTKAQLADALRRGRGPAHRYWPVFPYESLSGLTDADVTALWSYLRSVPPDPSPSVPQDPDVPRIGLWAWRTLFFRPTRAADRGEYLVEVVGHCSGCHSQRTGLGVERRRDRFAGNDQRPHPGPNLTPHPDGLAGWSQTDWVVFLQTGITADGDGVGNGMGHVIRDGTSKLSDADRSAMATYLRALPARPSTEEPASPVPPSLGRR